MTSYIAKRIQHRKRTLFAKFVTTISRLLTLQLINLLTQLIQSNPIHLTHQFTNLLSNLLIQNFLSNPLIAIFFDQIINHLKLIPYSQNLIAQFHIPQPLLLTQLIFQLLLHIQNSKIFRNHQKQSKS